MILICWLCPPSELLSIGPISAAVKFIGFGIRMFLMPMLFALLVFEMQSLFRTRSRTPSSELPE